MQLFESMTILGDTFRDARYSLSSLLSPRRKRTSKIACLLAFTAFTIYSISYYLFILLCASPSTFSADEQPPLSRQLIICEWYFIWADSKFLWIRQYSIRAPVMVSHYIFKYQIWARLINRCYEEGDGWIIARSLQSPRAGKISHFIYGLSNIIRYDNKCHIPRQKPIPQPTPLVIDLFTFPFPIFVSLSLGDSQRR